MAECKEPLQGPIQGARGSDVGNQLQILTHTHMHTLGTLPSSWGTLDN